MKKALAVLLTAMLALTMSLFGCSENKTDQGGSDNPVVEKPEEKGEILSVTIVYDGKPVTGGVVSLDITEGEITLSADVKTKGEVDASVQWASQTPSVAEISDSGLVTLKGVGETIISATAGGKEHNIVLSVGNNFTTVTQYSVTVVGGTSDVTSQAEGEQVTLIPAVEDYEKEHMSFVRWEYLNADTQEPIENLWLNGNVLRMPGVNLLVRAVLEDKLYTLNVVDGTIKSAVNDGQAVEDLHFTSNENINTYQLPFETQVTVQADEEEEGKMFVGWDAGMLNNRRGEPGQKEYSFTMPDETYSMFADFSETRPLTFGGCSFSAQKVDRVTSGVVDGAADADLRNLNGFRYTVTANKAADPEGYGGAAENLNTVNEFSTLRYGSQTVRVVFKNHSDKYSLKLEVLASMYSTIATSGVVTVGPGEVVEKKFVAAAGFHNPTFGIMLRENIGGSSSESVTFDVVYETADTFPSGDPQFKVPEAQYVQLEQRSTGADYPANSGIRGDCWLSGSTETGLDTSLNPTGVKLGGRKNTNNETGITNITTRNQYIDWKNGTPFITAKISNLPEYDPANPELTIYFRVVNTNYNKGTFDFGVGYSENPTGDATRVSTSDFVIEANESVVFGITITRTSDAPIYITIRMPRDDGGGTTERYDYNLVVQMLFNNKLSVTDENIYR